MAHHRGTIGSKLFQTVFCMVAACGAIPITDLLDRAAQRSDQLHSLSTTLTQDVDAHLPLTVRLTLPRPSLCHTASLQTPHDKEQALQVPESDLLSLARSLLRAWEDPLVVLSTSANALPHSALSVVSNKIQELREHSKSLGDGLNILSGKMGPEAQTLSTLPYTGGNDVGQDTVSQLINLNFLLSCFRRDSHKIDSFLKILRCRATMLPQMC
ncbi:prolactin [Spinachia spinachia]